MIRNLKAAFGLSVLVALVVGVMGAMSASATVSGHFSSDAPSGTTIIDAVEGTETTHKTVLSAYGATVECHKVTYTPSNVTGAKFTTITIFAKYESCMSGSNTATVRMNSCHYVFHSRSSGHATVQLVCSKAGDKAEVETPNGLEKFGPQTPTKGGATYTTTIGPTGKHALTVNITAEGIHAECHGLCQFLGTNTTTASLSGSVTVEGTDASSKERVNVTAT